MSLAGRAAVLLEPLRRYQGAAADFLDQRTPRERQMLAVMAAAIGLWLIYWLVVGLLLHPLEASRKSVQAREKALMDMLILQSDYRRIESQVATIDRMIRSGRHGNVLSRLEMMANQAQIKDKITSMDPKSASPNDLYSESVIEVRLKSVNLKQLVDYLFRIERANELLKIKRLRIKTLSDNPGYLDVNFRVSSFAPLPPGAQPAAGAAEGRQALAR